MSSSLVSSLYGGQEAAFQEQLKRQFRENLARDPVAMEAYQKATGGNTPWYSPSALSASENERAAAIRRTNQMSRGAQAVRERAIAQGRDVSVSPEGKIQIGAPDPYKDPYKAIGKYRTLPSGLSVDQVENLPGGGKAVYDREGRLVGTNVPVQVPADAATKSPGPFMDALDQAAFNRGEGTAAEKAALYPAMEAAVRQARMAKPVVATGTSVLPATSAVPTPEVQPGQEGLLPSIGLPVLEPGLTTDEWDAQMARNRAAANPEQAIGDLVRDRGGFFGAFAQELEKTAQQRARDMQEADRRAYERGPRGAGLSEEEMIRRSAGAEKLLQGMSAPIPDSVSNLLFGEEPFAAAAKQERRENAARARTSARISEIMEGARGPKKQEADVAATLLGRGLVPEVQQGLFSSALGLYDLYNNFLGRPLDRALFGIPIPETPSSKMEEYQRSLGRPTGWTGGL